MHIFNKIASRWVSGNRRNRQTSIFYAQHNNECSDLMLKSSYIDQSLLSVDRGLTNLAFPLLLSRKTVLSALSKARNFCLILGKGRTYSRDTFISRQAFRKLAQVGLLSGLQK